MAISNMQEVAEIGGGGFGGFGGGNNSMLWWVLIIIFVFLFAFKKDGNEGGYGRHGEMHLGVDSAMGTRDLFGQTEKIMGKTVDQAEKTRALIVHEAERRSDREYLTALVKDSAATAELKAKIASLESQMVTERRIDGVQAQIQLDFERTMAALSRKPDAMPCFANTCHVPMVSNCGSPEGRCGC